MNNLNYNEAQTALINNASLEDFGTNILTEVTRDAIAELSQIIHASETITQKLTDQFTNCFDAYADYIETKADNGQDFRQEFYTTAGAALLQKIAVQIYFSQQ